MVSLIKQLLFLITIFLSASYVHGQNTTSTVSRSISLELNGHHGFFIANHPLTKYLRTGHTSFAEFTLTKQTTGVKDWQIENNYPRMGLALLYGKPGSNEYIGKLLALYPFLQVSLFRSARFNSSIRLGLGLGWVEKTYDKITNYKNLAISLHTNACFSLKLQSELFLHKQLSLNAGLSFTHLSNGALKLPNRGLNMPTVSIGMRYLLQPPAAFVKRPLMPFHKKWNGYVYALAAFKQSYPLESATYLVYIINVETLRDFTRRGRYGGGINISYDRALSKEILNAPVYLFDKSHPQVQVSIYGSYEYVIGKLSIPVRIGIYVYNNYPVNSLYEGIGLRYRFGKKLSAILQQKAHFGKGDYFQWGLGYKL